MVAGDRTKLEFPLFKSPFSSTMSSGVKFHPDNCP